MVNSNNIYRALFLIYACLSLTIFVLVSHPPYLNHKEEKILAVLSEIDYLYILCCPNYYQKGETGKSREQFSTR